MLVEELRDIKELLDEGILTQEEFDRKKKQLLDQPTSFQTQNAVARSAVQPVAQNQKSKIAAGLLAIFLGALGIHKFYLGYTNQGVIMLLVTILGFLLIVGPIVMSIIALIEGIIYLTKTDEAFDYTYVQNTKPWF